MRLSYVLLMTPCKIRQNLGDHVLGGQARNDGGYGSADTTVNDAKNRLLRTAGATDLNNGDINEITALTDPEDSNHNERRVDFSASKLKRMFDDDTFMYKKFAKWDRAGYAANDVKGYLNLHDTKMARLVKNTASTSSST